MGKRIKKVWMETQGFSISAPPDFRLALPISPIKRLKKLSASFAFPARVVFWLILITLYDEAAPRPLFFLENIIGELDSAHADIFNKGGDITRSFELA